MSTKYIFITGGVCSSLGKGLAAASIGLLLERKGYSIALMKLDPYLNVDPGTMNPFQHGEVYVTDDGAETDLDLGHYFRFTNSPISSLSNATSGQIYHKVIQKERHGDYLGETVQVIPHITEEIKARITACAEQKPHLDIVLIEIGGTVGDIESLPFLEAIRQFRHGNRHHCLNVHLTYVPRLQAAGEWKTKPSQHSVQGLREIGIIPDIILARCESPLPEDVKKKLALFCDVEEDNVIEEVDVAHSIYEVPLQLHEQQLDRKICTWLQLSDTPSQLQDWKALVETLRHPKGTVRIGIVGKYLQHQDAYKSVFEALAHGALANGYTLEYEKIAVDQLPLDHSIAQKLPPCDGYLVPGGFGRRGWEGKIRTAQYCREEQIPFFGICLGMQAMVVDFARHVLHLEGANSTELDPETEHPVISLLGKQEAIKEMGGSMRLGSYSCDLERNTKAHAAYGREQIHERHRHRWEFNNTYRDPFREQGFVFSGNHASGPLAEIVEIRDHPWMIGVQFHPEFSSKPTAPHPLFRDFIRAMIARKNGKK